MSNSISWLNSVVFTSGRDHMTNFREKRGKIFQQKLFFYQKNGRFSNNFPELFSCTSFNLN